MTTDPGLILAQDSVQVHPPGPPAGTAARDDSRLTADGWLSLLTSVGLGRGRTNFQFNMDAGLSLDQLEELYHGDPYAGRIARAIPGEALRQGYQVQTGDPGLDEAMAGYLDERKLSLRLMRAWTWGRVFGGGAVFVGADDGRDPREPIDESSILALPFFTDLDRREMIPSWWYANALNPKFGLVEVYRFMRTGGVNVDTREVHESRLLRFEGSLVTRRRQVQLQGWGESELNRVFTDLQQFRGAFAAAANLVQDASQGVISMQGLAAAMAADKDHIVRQRISIMDMSRSVLRAMLIDADKEKFDRVEVGALTGVSEVMRLFLLLLSGASEIPVTILMGQAPAGLNATGDSDIRTFYDRVRTEQKNTLDPLVRRAVRLAFLAKDGPSRGVLPSKWKVTYNPLWQETPTEKADNRLKISQAMKIYIEAGVLLPEEVAISLFSGNPEDREITIDVGARKAALEAEKAEAATQATGGKPPPQASPRKPLAPPTRVPVKPPEELSAAPGFKAPPLPDRPVDSPIWVPPPQRGGPSATTTGDVPVPGVEDRTRQMAEASNPGAGK